MGNIKTQRNILAVLLIAYVLLSIPQIVAGAEFYRSLPATPTPEYQRDNELLRFGLIDPLIDGHLVYGPVATLEDYQAAIDRISIPADWLWSAYRNIEPVSIAEPSQGLHELAYTIRGEDRAAYAYHLVGNGDCAILIIPGSGLNQSTAIVNGEGYHGNIGATSQALCDTFVYVKPAEDALAIHNGTHKTNLNFIVNAMVNHGSSYSAAYLIEAIAWAKYLEAEYSKLIIAGLSQGGTAALLVSMQAAPDGVIVASGYTIIPVEWSSYTQIIIPGVYDKYSPDVVRQTIADSQTKWFFTYGAGEEGAYRIEANEATTCDYFGLDNVTCGIHARCHEFYAVEEFVSAIIAR